MEYDVENAKKAKALRADETCFGKRKYGRGRRVCSNDQQSAQVVTTTQRDGGKTSKNILFAVCQTAPVGR